MTTSGETHVALVMVKYRLTPLKRMTIPRLDLTPATHTYEQYRVNNLPNCISLGSVRKLERTHLKYLAPGHCVHVLKNTLGPHVCI